MARWISGNAEGKHREPAHRSPRTIGAILTAFSGEAISELSYWFLCSGILCTPLGDPRIPREMTRGSKRSLVVGADRWTQTAVPWSESRFVGSCSD